MLLPADILGVAHKVFASLHSTLATMNNVCKHHVPARARALCHHRGRWFCNGQAARKSPFCSSSPAPPPSPSSLRKWNKTHPSTRNYTATWHALLSCWLIEEEQLETWSLLGGSHPQKALMCPSMVRVTPLRWAMQEVPCICWGKSNTASPALQWCWKRPKASGSCLCSP